MKNQKEILTFEEYKNYLKAYPIFGELELLISKESDGYKIVVFDKEVCEYIDDDGNKNTVDMSNKVVTMYTDKEGMIGFIEHGFGAFTKANKNLVIHTANFVGKQIDNIEKYINQ